MELNRPTREQIAQAMAKSVLGAVPVVGSAFVETFSILFRSPFEQRAEQWMQQLGTRLHIIEDRIPGRVAALAEDPLFLSVVTTTTQAALRTHNGEKRKLLGNALQTSGLGTRVEPDLQMTFIRFVDELTPSHFRHLKAMALADAELQAVRSYPALRSLCMQRTSTECSPDEFMLICGELTARSLLRVCASMDSFGDVAESTYMVADGPANSGSYVRVTDIGLALLNYVGDEPELT